MIAAFLVRGMAALLARLSRIESDMNVLLRDRSTDRGTTGQGPWPDRDW